MQSMFSNLMKVEIYRRKTGKFTNNGNSTHTLKKSERKLGNIWREMKMKTQHTKTDKIQ